MERSGVAPKIYQQWLILQFSVLTVGEVWGGMPHTPFVPPLVEVEEEHISADPRGKSTGQEHWLALAIIYFDQCRCSHFTDTSHIPNHSALFKNHLMRHYISSLHIILCFYHTGNHDTKWGKYFFSQISINHDNTYHYNTYRRGKGTFILFGFVYVLLK